MRLGHKSEIIVLSEEEAVVAAVYVDDDNTAAVLRQKLTANGFIRQKMLRVPGVVEASIREQEPRLYECEVEAEAHRNALLDAFLNATETDDLELPPEISDLGATRVQEIGREACTELVRLAAGAS